MSVISDVAIATSLSVRTVSEFGSSASAAGAGLLGSFLSVVGNVTLGSPVSSRDFIRVSSSLSADGLLRIGSLQNLSIIDGALIGSAVSVAGGCELGPISAQMSR
jgi:hypothetical protein